MERFSHRESVLLGYSPRRSLTYSSSPRTPHRTSDLDFNDVFGGPPRRSSMQDKLSFSETTEFSGEGDDDEQLSCMRLGEKPVFGEENVNRRRYPSDVFFDDIFRGDESLSSTPRKRGKDPFASSPGSRVLSPARPLPPKVEPFGSSSMLPQFSLPAKSAEGMEFEDFGSTARTPSKFKDGASGGISFSYASSPALSRFSSQAIHSQEESGNDVQSCHCQPPLSQEVFLSREELLSSMKSDERNTEVIMKKEPDSSEIPSDSSQFHFSIYKWASKGVPLPMPFRGGSGSRTKDPMKFERYSRWNIRIAGNKSRVSPTKSSRTEGNRQENDSNLGMNAQDVTEVVLPTPESETPSSLQNLVEHPPGNATSQDMKKETKPQSMPVIDFCDKAEKEFTVVTEEVRRPASKTLYSLFSDNNYEQGDNDVTEKTADKESTVKSSKTPSSVVDASKNESKQDGKRITMNGIEAHKATFQDSPIHPGANLGRKGVKGKVKEFVKIFSQETSPKPKDDVGSRRQGSNWTKGGTYGEGNKQSIGATGLDENIHTVHVNSTTPGSSVKTDEHLKQPEKEHSATKTTNHIFTDTLSRQKENSSSSTVSTPSGSKATVEDKYELFQANFPIKELNHGEKELPESGDNHEEIQGIDVKIRQWSDGKKGNIRSLLSTLQYVLWPQSGWKPVPLVDIIEGNSVKRAYQKALLCLHPDKLQQKGAASNQKYTAEKVFEILQEAWDHFNSLGS